ncbi:hypothetical protein DFH08DRAFT_951954 [Mycena albidolilacea]|uniref:Uncharacterized protein n=1 Tax=Mycena albidolilacea TaxID=1033008 RepID=A0AAD7F1E2_9AGAR|nr:hypothetical protein DFH08DRAFT_951954 [Mycena albidolilacea]
MKVIYFDIYGTLIDKEAGVFEALGSLLSHSAYQFDRNEAVSFYLESELDDVALLLGIEYTEPDSLLLAQSINDWPLVLHAVSCLATLRTIPGLSIAAIADADHDSLLRTPAFAALAPSFDTVFTWDACAAYKPDLAVFSNPLSYYDALGVPRQRTCLVSGSLFMDLEEATLHEAAYPMVTETLEALSTTFGGQYPYRKIFSKATVAVGFRCRVRDDRCDQYYAKDDSAV